MTQREDPKGTASIEAFKAHMESERGADWGAVSGAQLQAFVEGWAVHAFWWGPAHHFKRIGLTDEVLSRCGRRGLVRSMFGQGGFRRCKLCQKSVDRRP